MSIEISTLSNGLRVVSEHMPGLQSASVGLWVSAGGRHETAQENGIAHFLEHMAFKGTARRSALQIAEEIEDVGGYINAYTSKESTAYYARCLSADVPLALDVIADIVLNPVFSPDDIETERHVILQEIGQALDTPDDIIFDWLQEVSYADQPIGRSILGPEERVSAFSRDDLTRFVGRHYAPERMVVSAAGGVDHSALIAQVETLFAQRPHVLAPPQEPARFIGGERREIKALEQAHFTLSFAGPGYRDSAIYTSQLYASVMGGGMSSRLFQKIREEHGLCYSIFAQASAFEDSGALMIYAGTSQSELKSLAGLTIEELKRSAHDISQAELERARAQMKAGLLMGLEASASRVERNARALAIWGRVPGMDEMVAKIDAVGCDDLHEFAQNLAVAPAAMALYGPVDDAPDLATLRGALAG